jgi:hypothetical protein
MELITHPVHLASGTSVSKGMFPDIPFRGCLVYHVRVPDVTELPVSFILATFKTITAGLPDISPRRLVHTDVSNDHDAFIFRVKPSKCQ